MSGLSIFSILVNMTYHKRINVVIQLLERFGAGYLTLSIAVIVVIVGVGSIALAMHQSPAFDYGVRSFIQPSSFDTYMRDEDPFNILLLGYGGDGHDGTYLTDSIIIAHIQPAKEIITLVSVPRDIWVKIPTNGLKGSYWKINATYTIGKHDDDFPYKLEQFTGEHGAGNLTMSIVETVTGLDIEYYTAINFQVLVDVVNALGGIDVEVEKSFDDYQYPIAGMETNLCNKTEAELPQLTVLAQTDPVAAFPCRYEHIHFEEGVQHMDGQKALQFVRSRYSVENGSDFGRSERQKRVLQGIKNKVYSLDFISQLLPLYETLKRDIETNVSVGDVRSLLRYAGAFQSYKIESISLSTDNVLREEQSQDGQDILIPKEGREHWVDIHTWLAKKLDPGRIDISPIIQIENGTEIAGLAELATNKLSDKDLQVLIPYSSENKDIHKTAIIVYDTHVDQNIVRDLEREFNTQAIYQSTSDIDNPRYTILVVVGYDYYLDHGKHIIN